MCSHAFCKLLGLGKARFTRLRRNVRQGALEVDGRFVAKARTKAPTANRRLVHDFLEELWNTLSEPMPEADDPGVVKQLRFQKVRGKRPRVSSRQKHLRPAEKGQLRLLPPGTFSDYLLILRARHADRKPQISLKLFSAASCHDVLGLSCLLRWRKY